MPDFDLALPDGRTLAATVAGDPDGELIVYHHGTPMSRALMPSWVEDARARGVRLAAFDRPGYGGSTRLPARTVASAAADTAALADHLGADRFATWGLSGGGPHALACAALLPDRVTAAATMGGVAPYRAEGLDFLAGMGADNIEEFGAAVEGEAAIISYLAQARDEILAHPDADLADLMDSLLPDVDKEAVRGGVGDFLRTAMLGGLAPSADGWIDDDLAFVAQWGFDPATITVPVLVLQAELDLMVPLAHGRWLGGGIPGAEFREATGEGHLSLLPQAGSVHEWLIGRGGA